jgi:hypothetical protein
MSLVGDAIDRFRAVSLFVDIDQATAAQARPRSVPTFYFSWVYILAERLSTIGVAVRSCQQSALARTCRRFGHVGSGSRADPAAHHRDRRAFAGRKFDLRSRHHFDGPEFSTLAMLLLGFVAVGFTVYRRNSSQHFASPESRSPNLN